MSADVKTPRTSSNTHRRTQTAPHKFDFMKPLEKHDFTKEEKIEREHQFTLDCIAVSTFTLDSQNYNPKHPVGIPPYNSRHDKHVNNYFRPDGVQKTLKKTGQWKNGGDSLNGKNVDNLYRSSSLSRYMEDRNQHGAGHSDLIVRGHNSYLADAKPMSGYNGDAGYRRNTFSLRKRPDLLGGRLVSGK